MHVAVDANILIADPWLRSQRIRVLLDYLTKTESQLWLLAVVEMEVAAHVRRQVTASANAIAAALSSARRHEVAPLPEFSANDTVEATLERWRNRLDEVTSDVVYRVDLDSSALPEALRRACERIAPCGEDRSELRDAIIWLNLLRHAETLDSTQRLAFISANTKDFAAEDRHSLRPELVADLAVAKIGLIYFSSLDDFIREYADPFLKITKEWLAEHLDLHEVEELIKNELDSFGSSFRPSSAEYREYYEPIGYPFIHNVYVTIEGYYVWEFEQGQTEIQVSCYALVEADITCERVARPFSRGWEAIDIEDDYTPIRTLTCFTELMVSVIAQVDAGEITSICVEEIARA
jgi:hypothetical protein